MKNRKPDKVVMISGKAIIQNCSKELGMVMYVHSTKKAKKIHNPWL
jgi:hypothetical protein